MKTENLKHFLVLVPHRDTRLVLRNYSAALLKAGFTGAYGFPWVAPLAELSRPLNTQEIKNIAHTFRKSAIDGKFNAEGMYVIPFPLGENKTNLSGPRLALTIPPDLFAGGIGNTFSQTLIGACLLEDGQNKNALPYPPTLSFSAAALANMSWQPVSLPAQDAQHSEQHNAQHYAFGYKWEIGKLCWLPKKAE